MRTFVATISSKGQVTIPADVRRQLGVGPSDQLTFVVTDEGTVELRPTRFSLESALGSLPPLPNESIDFEAEIDEAVADVAARRVRRLNERR